MTRRVTRVCISCDGNGCPEWIDFSVAKDGNMGLPIGWLSVVPNMHFCPACREKGVENGPLLLIRIRWIAEEFHTRVHSTDDLKKIHDYVWDVLSSIKPWLGDNYQRDPTVNEA